MNETNILNTVIKECFWDYDYTTKDIENIIYGNQKDEKLYLLKKIILNSSDFFRVAKRLFKENDLKELLEKIPYGCFKHEFQNTRVAALRNHYLGETNAPERLRWTL
ncbi:hypothetical protein MTBBW1_1270041 [Desulfamplus magnetovallimortis]|uniref:Uncharacterized protein n=1 Tax=Desulfamplus magnetovallimortis TaxID=1246637 RepID=A0A1W1H6T3_9BACT|nr:hypothetical protein [Desulfamplus magnetovallimortis]SLM28191.1 hypothetical protein MTBBW1_1270041 [Desulfamplus magnetovallimortis]